LYEPTAQTSRPDVAAAACSVAAPVLGLGLTRPSPGAGDDWLFGITRVPGGGGFWAVGTAGGRTLTEFHC